MKTTISEIKQKLQRIQELLDLRRSLLREAGALGRGEQSLSLGQGKWSPKR